MPTTEELIRQLEDLESKSTDDLIAQLEGSQQNVTRQRDLAQDQGSPRGGATRSFEPTFAERIGLTGNPDVRTPFGLGSETAKAVFPRVSELPSEQIASPTSKTLPGSIAKGTKDVLSLPGRALSALPSGVGQSIRGLSDRLGTNIGAGQSFGEMLSKTKTGNPVSDIVRDPSLPISILAGTSATKAIGTGAGALGKIGSGLLAGGLEGATTGLARQGLSAAEGEGFDAGELAGEVGGSAIFGGLSGGAEWLLKSKIAPALYRSSMKPTKAVRVKGFDPENITKYDIDGSFDVISKKANQKILAAKDAADNYLETFANENPTSTVNIDDIFQKFLEDIDAGNLDSYFAADQMGAVESSLDKILESFNKRGYTGSGGVPVSMANSAKRWLGKGVFKKGAAPTIEESVSTKVKELLDLRIRDEIQVIAPEIQKYNKVMKDLIPVRMAADDASDRFANRNAITGLTNNIIGGTSALSAVMSGDVKPLYVGLPLMAANQYLSPGRGAALTSKFGTVAGTIANIGGRSQLGGGAGRAINRVINPDEEEEKKKAMERMSAPFVGR